MSEKNKQNSQIHPILGLFSCGATPYPVLCVCVSVCLSFYLCICPRFEFKANLPQIILWISLLILDRYSFVLKMQYQSLYQNNSCSPSIQGAKVITLKFPRIFSLRSITHCSVFGQSNTPSRSSLSIPIIKM